MKPKIFIAMVYCVFLATGCHYDSPQEIACSTTNVTYSNTIMSIINSNNCLTCHGTPLNNNAPFNLETYANVFAQKDRLFGALNHSNGFAPMPQGLPKLNQCDIDKVAIWVASGAPQ